MTVDDDDDDLDRDDFGGDDEDDDTVPCPYCREPVYEGAERCPHCGQYVSEEDAPRRRPWWLIPGVAVCLAVVAWWVLNR